jgi:post-segregation antitoxin (ccd killing protein)
MRNPPVSSSPYDYRTEDPNGFVAIVQVDTDAYRRLHDNRAVKKTLSIPNWLNERATAAHLNFSAVLQDGLKRQLGI